MTDPIPRSSGSQSIDPRNPDDITEDELSKLRYQYGGIRGGFRGTSCSGPSQWVDEYPGFMAYPKPDFDLMESL